jgi:hypothetical protein
VQDVQRAFAELDWITPVPAHFLHTWIAGVAFAARRPTRDGIDLAVERAERALAGTDSFEVRYRRVNCFHSAVVVEVEDGGPRALATQLIESRYWHELPLEGAMGSLALETFLPHLSIGFVNRPSDPTPLREVLVPHRGAEFGRGRVEDATLCLIPASRTTILEPWEVVGSVSLG